MLDAGIREIKKGKDLHRTAQPPTLASVKTWGDSEGAGRISLTRVRR